MMSSFEFEHESHGRGRKAGVGVQQRDDRRHVRAADGNDQEHADDQGDADDHGEQFLRAGMQHEIDGAGDGDREEQEVDEVLSFIGDRPLGQNFLQLSSGHQTAGESQAAEDDFHREHRHHEFRDVRAAQIELGGADQCDAERAEGVAEGGSLRDGGHLHHAQRDADAAAQHEPDDDPLVVDDAVVEQGAGDGQHHADLAGQNAVAGGGGRTHPLQRKNEQGAGDEIDDFDEGLASGKLGHDCAQLLVGRTAGFEHSQHAVGDEESADHVAGGGDDGDDPKHGCESALLLAHQDNCADDGDGVESVGQRHERRMQQGRDVADDFESDEGRQHEYEKRVDQVGTHVLPRGLKPQIILTIAGAARSRAPSKQNSRNKARQPLSACRSQGRQFEEFADAGVDYFTTTRDQGFADDFVLQVQLQLAVLHHVGEEGRDVARVHLTGVIGDAAGEVDGADDGDAVRRHGFSVARQFAVAAALGGQVDDHRAGRHSFDHLGRDQHR